MAFVSNVNLQDVFTDQRLRLLELHFEQLRYNDIKVNFVEFTTMIESDMGNVLSKSELNLLFHKIDTMSVGYIDWYDFISYILSEMQMREQILANYKGALKTNFRIVKQRENQDSICAVDIMPHLSSDGRIVDYLTGRYLTASKDGCICVWSQQWQLLKSKQCFTDWTQRTKSTWMLHMTCLPNAFMIGVATANETINFYDYNSNKLDLVYSLCEIGAIVTCLHYWFSPSQPKDGFLTFGDNKGNVTLLRFVDCVENKLFGVNPTKRSTQRINFAEVLSKKNKFVYAIHFSPMHDEWVKQVLYIPHIKSILSCSLNSNFSMILQSTLLDLPKRVFTVNRGINCFDYDKKLCLIATGGIDRCLRVWNPFINKRCMTSFYGHSTPITHVLVIAEAEQLLSLSKDKSIKIWDLKDETCIQSIFGRLIPTGPYPISSIYHNKLKRQIILTSFYILSIDRKWEGESTVYSKFLTHPKPLVGVLYSVLFNEVITACEQGIIIFWRLETGKKSVQIPNAHSIRIDGILTGVEITAMAIDESDKLLITAGFDKFVKMWNLSNSGLLHTLSTVNMQEINVIVAGRNDIYFAGWDRRVYQSSATLNTESVKIWPIRHEDDIVHMAFLEPNTLVTCSWDGKAKIWRRELGIIKKSFSLFEYFAEKNLTFKLSGSTVYYSDKGSIPERPILKNNSQSHSSEVSSLKLKSKPKPLPERSQALSRIRDNPPAFTRMLVLEKRKLHASTGNLLLANMNGVIEFWSTHLNGRPLAIFGCTAASHHFVTAMATDPDNNFLFTGDSQGYIRVWYIRYYHNMNEDPTVNPNVPNEDNADFPFMRSEYLPLTNKVKKMLSDSKPSEYSPWLDVEHPPIVSSFRAHLVIIKQITYVPEKKLLLSASSDQSVRMWTQCGRYLATFGDNRGWNLQNLLTKPVKSIERSVPFDILKVGSAVTLQLELGGIGYLWSKLRHFFLYLYVKNVMRRKRKKSRVDLSDSQSLNEMNIENLRKFTKEQELMQLESPIGKYFQFKESPRKLLVLPTISKAKKEMRGVYAYMLHFEIEPLSIKETVSTIAEPTAKLKYRQNISTWMPTQ